MSPISRNLTRRGSRVIFYEIRVIKALLQCAVFDGETFSNETVSKITPVIREWTRYAARKSEATTEEHVKAWGAVGVSGIRCCENDLPRRVNFVDVVWTMTELEGNPLEVLQGSVNALTVDNGPSNTVEPTIAADFPMAELAKSNQGSTEIQRAMLSHTSNTPMGKFDPMNPRNPAILVPDFTSISEVKRKATEHSRRIFEYWEKLHQILEKHENVLHKRWNKFSEHRRKKVLLNAWPEMATMHRPDFHALRHECNRGNATCFRKEYLFPYINLEDLLKPRNLLLFFHSRGHNPPDLFSSSDRTSYRVGRTSNAIRPPLLEGYVMRLNGQTSPETYGTLSVHEDAQDFIIGDKPGEGLVTLEIQEEILLFLVKCAEIILHDLLPLTESSISVPQSLPPPPASIYTDTKWSSVATVVAEAPYQVPQRFDLSGVQALVSAKCSEAKDHIWLLRNDPGYFGRVVFDYSEHRPERILDVDGNPHPDLEKPIFWRNVLDWVVKDAYSNVVMWDCTEKELSNLVELRDRDGSRINLNQPMPSDYEIALCHFRSLIERMRFAPLLNFQQGISSSLLMRKYYRRKQDYDGSVAIVAESEKRQDEYLLWLIERFSKDDQIQSFGLLDLVDELGHITQKSNNVQYISSWIATIISDLGIIGELEGKLTFHQPLIPLSVPEKELSPESKTRTALVDVVFQAGNAFEEYRFSLTNFNYPDGKRTAGTTAKRREAERNLDDFWRKVDQYYVRNQGKPLHELLPGISVSLELNRTPEWVQPSPRPTPPGPGTLITENFQTTWIDDQPHARESIKPIKLKIKTRGNATEGNNETIPKEKTTERIPTIVVSLRSHEVFSAIFHSTEGPSVGNIPWGEFLFAFAEVGFRIQQRHGAICLFTPLDGNMRPITFHKPHPSNELPIQSAWYFGSRLKRAYGWSGQTFVRTN